ncbi:ArsR/SmtB family transcription factor (plasmid) [Haloferax sp. S1W]|uniref:ArsR/SmtB family transcription factor n=1 Tax=Haloferax sp. S1W TaxID=3377110 RepID=UPI0037C9E025
MNEDPELGELLDILSDEYARDILAATSLEPMSAQQLADQCEMSKPTAYRRIEQLQSYGLLEEQTKVETSTNNYSVYVASLTGVDISLAEGQFEATVSRTDADQFPGQEESDTADRFTKMWENL